MLEKRRSTLLLGSPIEGVTLRRLDEHRDARGSFTEVYQDKWEAMAQPCQWSLVRSIENTFRGCHLHRRHDEYFCLVEGEVSLGLRDERPWSSTRGNWQLYRLIGADLAALTFQAGTLHGWYSHTDTIHIQAVSESYETYGPDDNAGVHWADPELGIPWPFDEPLLADRASGFGSLRELHKSLARWQQPE